MSTHCREDDQAEATVAIELYRLADKEKRMHIGMIYGENRPFPPDIRVEKEIKALSTVGHDVTVLAKRIPHSASPIDRQV